MGLEKRQNEASRHEPQEDPENHEEVRINYESEKKESVQNDHEEDDGAQNISKSTSKRVSSARSVQSILHRYYLHTIPRTLCIPFGNQRYRKRRSNCLVPFHVFRDDFGHRNPEGNQTGIIRKCDDPFRPRIPLHKSGLHRYCEGVENGSIHVGQRKLYRQCTNRIVLRTSER